MDLRTQIQKRISKRFPIWKNSLFDHSKARLKTNFKHFPGFRNSQTVSCALDLSGQSPDSIQAQLNNQKGFVQVLFVSLLPVLLTGFLFVLFSQFILKNWMESLHICRTELLSAQKRTSVPLSTLMKLNNLAKALRIALRTAQIELAIGIATENAAQIAKATADILRIQNQQKQLDLYQKALILQGNLEMNRGLQSVATKLRAQDHALQARLPDIFGFRIYSILPVHAKLAVKPDKPDIAPVYELLPEFTKQQTLSVSWISEFKTKNAQRYQWLQNSHKKRDGCSGSLSSEKDSFTENLVEGKSSSRL
jgi:hypothetical protein